MLTDFPAQPVVELGDQPMLAPAPEEGVDPAPAGEDRGQCPPRDPAGDQVTDRVQQLPMAVALGPSAPPLKPGRHGQQWPHGRPLRVRHVRRIPAHPIGMIGRVAGACARQSHDTAGELKSTGSGAYNNDNRASGNRSEWGRTPELPRGPVLMRVAPEDHPTRNSVRSTRSKIR